MAAVVPNMGFGGFDFSDVFSRAGTRPPGGAPPSGSARRNRKFPGHFQPVVQPQRRLPAAEGSAKRHRSRVRAGYRFLAGHPWHSGSFERQSSGGLRGLQRHRSARRCERCLSGMQRQWERDAGGRCDALQSHLPALRGSGRLGNRCTDCHGDGRISKTEIVEVRIPPGAQQGSRLRVAGKGNAGTFGAPAGDLYITVRVEPHPFFRRDGDDIEITVPIRIDEAGLGTKIEVPTIDGRALLKIPQGTKNGQKFRLREKGVLNARTDRARGSARRSDRRSPGGPRRAN